MKRDDALWKAILEDTFEDDISQKNTTMGIEQFLLERAKKEGIQEGLERGVEQGAEQEKRSIVVRLLTKIDFSLEKIADVAGVSVAFVTKIKKNLPPSV